MILLRRGLISKRPRFLVVVRKRTFEILLHVDADVALHYYFTGFSQLQILAASLLS